jgi:RNA polymerase sigma-70 factor, ECF subfamily
MAVVRDLPRFTGGEEEFRRWLFTIGRHRAIDHARARQRRPAIPVPQMPAGALVDDELVEDEVLHAMSARKAVLLLGALPVDQAETIALRVLAGLDTPAVARILGKSPGAVRVALHRGLRRLAGHPDVQDLARALQGSGGEVDP